MPAELLTSQPRAAQMQMAVGRLAPSPTGALHLGNARSFLCAWLSMRQQRGCVILRIEDIDSPRVKPWARESTLTDLRWLGLDWDQGPDVGGPDVPYVQSERIEHYQPVLQQLIERDLVYPCDCSRSEVASSASAPHEALEGPIYSGNCRQRKAQDARLFKASEFAWRFRASRVSRTWHDKVSGLHTAQVSSQLGDFIIAKGDGSPAYQLAVVVDDYLMAVTEVMRGNDLVPSTFRQLDLLAAFQWPAPRYAHLPLMVGPDGRRLAKRHGDTRLSWFRESGYQPDQIVGYLAWTAGLVRVPTRLHPSELMDVWSPLSLAPAPTVVSLPDVLKLLEGMACRA